MPIFPEPDRPRMIRWAQGPAGHDDLTGQRDLEHVTYIGGARQDDSGFEGWQNILEQDKFLPFCHGLRIRAKRKVILLPKVVATWLP